MAVEQPKIGGFQQPPPMQQPVAPPMDLGQMAQPTQGAPADMSQRVSGWQAFFDALSQPGVAESLMQAGATMMQPVPMGGSPIGQFGKGVSVGTETLVKSQDKANQLALQQGYLGEAKTRTGLAQEEMGLRRKQDARETELQSKNIEVLAEQLKTARDPVQRQLIIDKLNAEIAAEKAQAGLYGAQADYYGKGGAAARAGEAASVQEIRLRAQVEKDINPSLTDGQAMDRAQQFYNTSRDDPQAEYIKILTSLSNDIKNFNVPREQILDQADMIMTGLRGPNWRTAGQVQTADPRTSAPKVYEPGQGQPPYAQSAPALGAPTAGPATKPTPTANAIAGFHSRMRLATTDEAKNKLRSDWTNIYDRAPPG